MLYEVITAGMIITDSIITWTPVAGTTNSGIVTLTVSDGLLNDIENFIVFVSTVGISDFSETNINVYPNPASDILIVKSGVLKVENVIVTDRNNFV